MKEQAQRRQCAHVKFIYFSYFITLYKFYATEEQKEADRIAAQEAMQAELDELRRDRQITGYKAAYLSMGYDEKLAAETAEAQASGDTDTVFANMRKHNAQLEKNLRAQILKETPRAPAGEDPDRKKEFKNTLRKSMGL